MIFSLMNKKFTKGQISIFVIVAVILVLGIILFFSLNSDSINFFSADKSSYKVKKFVESCVELESNEGMNQIGIHGGWLYHKDMIFTDRSKPDIYNKNARGLNFLEKIEMPYWFYYDDANDEFKFQIPEYDTNYEYSLKNQLKRYVDENLDKNCLEGFKAFEEIYVVNYDVNEIETKVIFDEDNLRVDVYLPLEIVEENTQTVEYVDTFSIKGDNKLWVPYHLARDITIAQSKNSFIEKRVMSFVDLYSDADTRDLLPPTYDFAMKYDFEPWSVPKVEKLVKQIVESDIGEIQFLGTNVRYSGVADELRGSEFANGVNNLYVKDYFTGFVDTMDENPKVFNEYENYEVVPTFESAFFPMYFNLGGSAGNVVLLPRPQALISFIPFFFTEYVAVYEMSFPTLFVIDDDGGYDGFEFNLAIEANIDYNTPLVENQNFDFDASDLNINDGRTLICEPVQFISDYVALNISDPVINGERKFVSRLRDYNMPVTGVEGAFVTFDCRGLAECFMGQTSINGIYTNENITQLKFRLPVDCNPGTLEIYKPGYQKLVFENLNPKVDERINLGNHMMASEKEFKVDVSLIKIGYNTYGSVSALDEFDEAFVIFESLDTEDYVQVLEITEENQYDLNVKLLPGNYSVSGYLIYANNVTIPEERRSYDDKDVTLPMIEMESWVKGGLELEMFEVSLNDVLRKDNLRVKLVDMGVPSNYGELETMSNNLGNLKGMSLGREPEFE